MVAPHSMGRHEHQRFRKAKVNIVERLINGLMRSGKNSGKKAKATNIVKEAFEIINLRTDKNPIEVLVKAVENASPCEDTTRISYGGVVYHLSVDVAPQRRIDLAIRHITEGARAASANNPRSIQETFADELVLPQLKTSRAQASLNAMKLNVLRSQADKLPSLFLILSFILTNFLTV